MSVALRSVAPLVARVAEVDPKNQRIAIGGGGLALAAYVLNRIQEMKLNDDDWAGLIQPGWGVYLTQVVGAFLVVSTFLVKRLPPPAPVMEPSTSVAQPA